MGMVKHKKEGVEWARSTSCVKKTTFLVVVSEINNPFNLRRETKEEELGLDSSTDYPCARSRHQDGRSWQPAFDIFSRTQWNSLPQGVAFLPTRLHGDVYCFPKPVKFRVATSTVSAGAPGSLTAAL